MRGALALRLTLALGATLFLLVMLFALALDALATQSERDLREGRYAYILAELKQRVEAPLSLGLQVESLDYLQRLLEREAAGDPDILSIDLFNSSGDQLFTTDADDIRSAVPSSWLQDTQNLPPPESEAEGRQEAYWLAEERDGRVVGVALYNDFGLLVGGLALRHQVTDVGESLLYPATLRLLAIAAVATFFGGLGFWWLNRPLERQTEALIAAVKERLKAPEALVPPGPLDRDGLRLLEALQEAERRCAAATAEVEQIDGRS